MYRGIPFDYEWIISANIINCFNSTLHYISNYAQIDLVNAIANCHLGWTLVQLKLETGWKDVIFGQGYKKHGLRVTRFPIIYLIILIFNQFNNSHKVENRILPTWTWLSRDASIRTLTLSPIEEDHSVISAKYVLIIVNNSQFLGILGLRIIHREIDLMIDEKSRFMAWGV